MCLPIPVLQAKRKPREGLNHPGMLSIRPGRRKARSLAHGSIPSLHCGTRPRAPLFGFGHHARWPKLLHPINLYGGSGQGRRSGVASHGAYWHRCTLKGKSDLLLMESGEIIERRIRTQRERFAAVLGARPPRKSSSSHRPTARGWQGSSRGPCGGCQRAAAPPSAPRETLLGSLACGAGRRVARRRLSDLSFLRSPKRVAERASEFATRSGAPNGGSGRSSAEDGTTNAHHRFDKT